LKIHCHRIGIWEERYANFRQRTFQRNCIEVHGFVAAMYTYVVIEGPSLSTNNRKRSGRCVRTSAEQVDFHQVGIPIQHCRLLAKVKLAASLTLSLVG